MIAAVNAKLNALGWHSRCDFAVLNILTAAFLLVG